MTAARAHSGMTRDEVIDRLVDSGFLFTDRTDLAAVAKELHKASEDTERVPQWLRSEAHLAARQIERGLA